MHYEIVDLRNEFRKFELEYRIWPKSGSVSKPFRLDMTDPLDRWWLMHSWSPQDIERADRERETEEFYRWHHAVLIIDKIVPFRLMTGGTK